MDGAPMHPTAISPHFLRCRDYFVVDQALGRHVRALHRRGYLRWNYEM